MIKGFLPEQNTEKTTLICQSNRHTYVLCCLTPLYGIAVETKGGGGSCSLLLFNGNIFSYSWWGSVLVSVSGLVKIHFFFMGMYNISSLNINSRRNFCFVFFFINMCVCLHHDDGYMYVSFMCVYICVCVYMCVCIYMHISCICVCICI